MYLVKSNVNYLKPGQRIAHGTTSLSGHLGKNNIILVNCPRGFWQISTINQPFHLLSQFGNFYFGHFWNILSPRGELNVTTRELNYQEREREKEREIARVFLKIESFLEIASKKTKRHVRLHPGDGINFEMVYFRRMWGTRVRCPLLFPDFSSSEFPVVIDDVLLRGRGCPSSVREENEKSSFVSYRCSPRASQKGAAPKGAHANCVSCMQSVCCSTSCRYNSMCVRACMCTVFDQGYAVASYERKS